MNKVTWALVSGAFIAAVGTIAFCFRMVVGIDWVALLSAPGMIPAAYVTGIAAALSPATFLSTSNIPTTQL